MSEAQTSYGLHRHKYKVGDTFDFDGIVEIISLHDKVGVNNSPMYEMKMQDGRIQYLTEDWIDAGIDHFNLDEHGRKQDKEYGVSYIASAPEELKIGDRVEVVDAADRLHRKQGIVQTEPLDGYVWVEFEHNVSYYVKTAQLRKLPDTISFEKNPLDKQVGGSHYKDMAIQPIEFSMKNGLNACQHSIIKYICRYKHKNGKEDLLKAKHFIDLLIQLEYPE